MKRPAGLGRVVRFRSVKCNMMQRTREFSSNLYCRLCLIITDDLKLNIHVSNVQINTNRTLGLESSSPSLWIFVSHRFSDIKIWGDILSCPILFIYNSSYGSILACIIHFEEWTYTLHISQVLKQQAPCCFIPTNYVSGACSDDLKTLLKRARNQHQFSTSLC